MPNEIASYKSKFSKTCNQKRLELERKMIYMVTD